MKAIQIFIAILAAVSTGLAQTFEEKIVKEYSFEKKIAGNTVVVANINGDVKVSGYDGDKVMLEVTKKVRAKTQERLEEGKKEVQLGFVDRSDTLIFYAGSGCNDFGKLSKKERRSSGIAWGYHWDCNGRDRDCDKRYDYTLDFTLKVPASVSVILSTVNDGDVTVENLNGALHVENVNGAIKLTNVRREAWASTINGDVDVEYAANPQKPCRFYTLNGDINAWFQKGLTADMSFESFNGDLYTNVTQLESLPVVVEKEEHDNGMKYKVNGNRFRIGKGGILLDFETFNGDVYLKEKTN